MNTLRLLVPSLLLTTGCVVADDGYDEAVTETSDELTGGSYLAPHQQDGIFQAIGTTSQDCTATLIDHRVVLTAAHCHCAVSSPTGCLTRATFTMHEVTPVDDPSTSFDETQLGPTNVSVSGDLVIYPGFGAEGYLRRDFALIVLDEPVYDVAVGVVPQPVGDASRKPTTSTLLYLAGYGASTTTCSGPRGTGRFGSAYPWQVVTDAIRFDDGVLACPADMGGPVFDQDRFVLGVASRSMWSGSSVVESTYRPAYEIFGWIGDEIDDALEASEIYRFEVSRGRSWDLGAFADVDTFYYPAVGIVGQAIDPATTRVHTWYRNGTYSVGHQWDLDAYVKQRRFTTYVGYRPDDIVGMGFANNGRVYTWYRWGTVTVGTPDDLDSITSAYIFSPAPGRSASDIVGVDISSADVIFTWYDDGTRSIGTSWDLDAYGSAAPFALPTGRSHGEIVEMAIARHDDDKILTWFTPE